MKAFGGAAGMRVELREEILRARKEHKERITAREQRASQDGDAADDECVARVATDADAVEVSQVKPSL